MESASPNLTMPGALAPGASTPGHGIGNVPYAGGMISGNFGQKGGPQPAPHPLQAASPPPPGPPSPASGGPDSSPAPAPPGSPNGSPFLDPMFLFSVYDAIMKSLIDAADQPGPVWGYS